MELMSQITCSRWAGADRRGLETNPENDLGHKLTDKLMNDNISSGSKSKLFSFIFSKSLKREI